MGELSEMLFEQARAMNHAIASGVKLGEATAAKRIKELEKALLYLDSQGQASARRAIPGILSSRGQMHRPELLSQRSVLL